MPELAELAAMRAEYARLVELGDELEAQLEQVYKKQQALFDRILKEEDPLGVLD